MEFKLSEDDLMMQEAAAELSAKRIKPNAEKWDEEEGLPRDILDEMGELGYFGMLLPEEYGGLELTTVSYNTAMEELAAASAGLMVMLSVHNSLCCEAIHCLPGLQVRPIGGNGPAHVGRRASGCGYNRAVRHAGFGVVSAGRYRAGLLGRQGGLPQQPGADLIIDGGSGDGRRLGRGPAQGSQLLSIRFRGSPSGRLSGQTAAQAGIGAASRRR